MGLVSVAWAAFLMLSTPVLVNRWPLRALRVGMTQSNMSTPAATPVSNTPNIRTADTPQEQSTATHTGAPRNGESQQLPSSPSLSPSLSPCVQASSHGQLSHPSIAVKG